VIVCVPDSEAVAWLGELPDGVEVISWDGSGDPPARAGAVEFLVPPYPFAPHQSELLAALSNVKVVQLLSAGVDAWRGRLPDGALLCRGVGIHTGSTADLALTLALASLRRLPQYLRQQEQGRWEPVPSDEVVGKRVLVIGAGDIGAAIRRRFEAFDATVTMVGRTARDGVHATGELPELLPHHDIVVLIVPLTDETRGLVDPDFLAAMPDTALLINVARGGVVVTDALVAELQAGRLYAGLDVFDPEPLPPGHPLWSAPNVLITPHVGGGTVGWAGRGYQLVADQIRRYVAGAPVRYVVSGEY
jgi:phosphoglycerate dehydrogenase-like enzyme